MMTKMITWGQFKRQVEAQGLNDDTKLSYVDWDSALKPKVIFVFDNRASIGGHVIVDESDDA